MREVLLTLAVFFTKVQSEWVEIPQLPNDDQLYEFSGSPEERTSDMDYSTTASLNYATFMQTPTIISTTTPTPQHRKSTKPKSFNNTTLQNANRRLDGSFNKNVGRDKQFSTKTLNMKRNEAEDVTYAGFLPLLSNIQNTLITNARKTLKSKIAVLKDLKDNLLINIDKRVSGLWKRSTESHNLPEARGHDDHHEMEFPSNEGALMTIGLLTFAVFLIKLVLKLIYALKTKYANANNGMVPTGTAAGTVTTYIGRKKRNANLYDTLKILQYIEEYKFG